MEVKIDKKKLWKRKKLENVVILLFSVLIIPIMKGIAWMKDDTCFSDCKPLNTTNWIFILMGIYVIFVLIKLWLDKLYTESIRYDIEDDRLQQSYQVIVKTRDSARLQIINSVDVRQGLIDKIFEQFSFEINYGMGSGHFFSFPYLSEDEANKLMDTIRPSGKDVLMK